MNCSWAIWPNFRFTVLRYQSFCLLSLPLSLSFSHRRSFCVQFRVLELFKLLYYLMFWIDYCHTYFHWKLQFVIILLIFIHQISMRKTSSSIGVLNQLAQKQKHHQPICHSWKWHSKWDALEHFNSQFMDGQKRAYSFIEISLMEWIQIK